MTIAVCRAGRLRAAWQHGPLANHSFRLLATGQFTSATGDSCYAVALPWLILTGHGTPVLLGMVLACYGVPRTALIPVAGLLSDRVGARSLMLVADATRCVLVAVLAVIAWRHHASLAALGPVAALTGASEGLFIPPSYALLPSLLPPAQLQTGNAIATAAAEGGNLIGPALGGPLVAVAGPACAFAADAASFAVSAATLALIPGRLGRPGPERRKGLKRPEGSEGLEGLEEAASPKRLGGPEGLERSKGLGRPQVLEGWPGEAGQLWSLVRQERLLQIMLVVVIVANLASDGALEVATPALAHTRYGAIGYATMMVFLGAGSVAGNLAGVRGTAGRTPARTGPAVRSAVSFVLEGVAIIVLPFLGGLPGAAAAACMLGVTNGYGNVLLITLLQQWAPAELLGRVMSLIMLAAWGTLPLSAGIAGALVHRFGAAPYFPVAGAVVTVAVLGALTQREFRDLGQPQAAELPEELAEPVRNCR
ncbi:MAG TPA: MFS transporter [Streptosporangiaceae bacterium]|nr:MFS transporter [Streptosporangiaceae bacterium]